MEAILEVIASLLGDVDLSAITDLLGDVDVSAIVSALTSVVSYLVEIISGLM